MSGQLNVTLIARLLLLLAPWILIGYFLRDVDAALEVLEDASALPAVGGLLLMLVALVGTALLWVRLVAHLSRGLAMPDTLHLLRSFARSWLARYLPGKLWSFGARVAYTDASVTPRRIVATSLVDEFALIVGSATVLGVGLWTWDVVGTMVGLPVLLGGLAAVVVGVSKLDQVTQLLLSLLGRAMPQRWRSAGEELQQAVDDPGLGLRASALFAGGYLLTNLAWGFAFVLIVWSMSDIAWGDVALLVGGYNLAGVVSIFAFFVPAGLGVREGVLVGFLAPIVASPVAATLAVFIRLVTVVTDVAFLVSVEAVSLFARMTNKEPLPATSADSDHGVETPADPSGR